MAESLRIVSIGAHPADIFDQSGGAMAHHASRGDYVGCVVLTHGARVHDVVISDSMFHRDEVPEGPELLALMTGGLATIAGTVMTIYIGLGADPVSVLTTSVMAAPCGLYLSKILLPETETPVTAGTAEVGLERQHVNIIDALATGASDGTRLAINIAAMLIAFLAFIAMLDYGLGLINSNLSLAAIFGWLFAPVAALLGVSSADLLAVADLLGTKLATNEFVAFLKLNGNYLGTVTDHTRVVVTFALTGFANFGSVAILLGGIGGIAPSRRQDLARLGPAALLGGFLATLINASIASILL